MHDFQKKNLVLILVLLELMEEFNRFPSYKNLIGFRYVL